VIRWQADPGRRATRPEDRKRHADPPARRPPARRPRPGPHPAVQKGLPHPVGHRTDHRLDRDPKRPPGQAPLHRHRQNDAWLHTRYAAINLRTLLRHGLTRRDDAWALA
jgi:hypothetical protein